MDELKSPRPRPGKQKADVIELLGVQTNNLKNIDVCLPHNAITVITGPSGCGKSSLAFETIYAEAKRQFLESLSFQARQKLQFLRRPEIRQTNGLLPVVCIGQQTATANVRSTTATVTGIYDFLRLLMTRIGTVHCSRCRQVIDQTSTDQIEQSILGLPDRSKVMILAPVAPEFETAEAQIEAIRKAGFIRVRSDGNITDLDSLSPSTLPNGIKLEAVVDRIIIKTGIQDRISESVAHALRFGSGSLTILHQEQQTDTWQDRRFSTLYACPDCGNAYEEIEPRTFSYFSPFGVCLRCEGDGMVDQFAFQKILDSADVPLQDLAILRLIPEQARAQRLAELQPILSECGLAADDSLTGLSDEVLKNVFYGNARNIGLQTLLEKVLVSTIDRKLVEQLNAFRALEDCPDCLGSRLCTAANHVLVAGRNIGQIVQASISESETWFASLPMELDDEQKVIAEPVILEILNRLRFLNNVGLGYLTLDRRADTLSGGEFQRVKLATGLGNRLTDVCYILDEPTNGLHPADNDRLLEAIRNVRDLGNTVIVVEHDPAAMKIGDYLFDLGPGAGKAGGRIQGEGTYQQFLATSTSATARYLTGDLKIACRQPRQLPAEDQWLLIEGATLHNLKGDTFRVPARRLTCVTGVSGSGKSSMVSGVLVPAMKQVLGRNEKDNAEWGAVNHAELFDKIVEIDQSPIGRSPRSNAATFSGLFDEIRKVFAKTRLAKQLGFKATRFSFNNKSGACPACNGQGQTQVEMRFMPDVHVVCETCQGKRFNSATLSVEFKDKNIADVLDLSVNDALDFFENIERIRQVLLSLAKVGLGYLKLGQPATSLSGGEAQRLKIASLLASPHARRVLYVIDEPTSGLHFVDIERLQSVLQELVELGNTVILIEHHLDLIKNADFVIDFGPSGGIEGGHIVAAGTPQQIARDPSSVTGTYLASLFDPS